MAYQLVSSVMGTFLALFPIANPLGVVPIFYSLAGPLSPPKRSRQARQVALNAVVILVLFFLAGQLILDFFGISLGVLQMAGGLLVGQTGWQMMFHSSIPSAPNQEETLQTRDISLIPMAIPIVSGPGAIGMTIALAAQNESGWDYLGSLIGIGLLGAILYLCLALGEPVVKMLGKSGLTAFNQVLGFFILAIALQFITDGIFALFGSLG